MESFSQLLASDGAEKQIAGIIATAQRTFKTFTGRQLVSSFCGQTTIPLDMQGKRILFLQVDIEKRDAVSPLIAAILHLIITRNFAQRRKEPLILALDELPTLYLPDLPKWINEFRSNGFVALLGYQNFAQLQHIYGRDLSRALFAACGTKVFFNPKDRETANEFSGYLGEKRSATVHPFPESWALRGAEPFGTGAASSVDDGRPDSEAEAGGMCLHQSGLPGAGRRFSPAAGASAAFQTRTLGAGPQ